MTLLVKFLDVIILAMLVDVSAVECENQIAGPAGDALMLSYVARGYDVDGLSFECVDPRAVILDPGVAL